MNKLFFYIYYYKIWQLFLCIIAVSVVGIVLNSIFQKSKNWKKMCAIIFLMFIGFILTYTLFIRVNDEAVHSVTLIPFYSYYTHCIGKNPEGLRLCFTNMMLFYPIGFLFSCAVPNHWDLKKKMKIITVFAFALSISIELLQFIFHLGYAEVDDVIHNVFGAFVGTVLASYGTQFCNKFFLKHC